MKLLLVRLSKCPVHNTENIKRRRSLTSFKKIYYWFCLRLGLSHLRYHKFRHNFQDCINPMCDYGLETETTTHFLLHCPLFQSARQSLLMNIKKIDESILKKHDELITKTLLYGDDKFDLSCNKSIISSTIEFIVSTGRFSNLLV